MSAPAGRGLPGLRLTSRNLSSRSLSSRNLLHWLPRLRSSSLSLWLPLCVAALLWMPQAALSVQAQEISAIVADTPAEKAPASSGGVQPESPTDSDEGPPGIVPARRGFNVALVTTSQHDSSDGWSSLLTPSLAYRFSRHFSIDGNVPVYPYVNAELARGTVLKPVYLEETRHNALLDGEINTHYETRLGPARYNLTGTLGLPTGSKKLGLGAGQASYAFNNHFETDFGRFTPDIEIGITDSSSLEGQRVRKSFISVGTLAYFQAGGSVDLTHNASFTADAYEALPISSETVYSTTGRGRRKVTTVYTRSAAEDNGFETALDIPVGRHTVVSGFYNRSLRDHIDTAGFSLTFLMKGGGVRHSGMVH